MALTSYSTSYLQTTGVGFYRLNAASELLDRGLMVVQNGCIIGDRITGLIGHHRKAFGRVASPVETTRNVISATRFVPSLEKLFSGKMFFKVDSETGDFQYLKNDVHGVTKCSSRDPGAQKVRRDYIDIASDIILMVGRLFSPINLLHNTKAVNLGAHAQWTGLVSMIAFSTSTIIGAVQAVKELIEDREDIARKIIELISAFLDLLAMLPESGFGYENPILAIASGTVCVVAGIFYIVKEAYYSDYRVNG